MSKDINNLKEITDFILEDIKVTDELKSLTLKRCKEGKRRNIKPVFATAASAAIIAFSIFSYKFILHNPNLADTSNNKADKSVALNDLNKGNSSDKSSAQQNKLNNTTSNEIKPKTSVQQNISDAITKDNQAEEKISSPNNSAVTNSTKVENPTKSAEIKTSSNSTENRTTTSMSGRSISNNSGNKTKEAPINDLLNETAPLMKSSLIAPSSTTIANAEKFWGGKVLTPSYIPEGFELTDVSIPKDSSKEVCVKLNYSFENTYFRIIQNKSTTYSNCTGTSVTINGSEAHISKSNDTNNPDSVVTEINWVNNNVQYTIIGNLSENELTKILKSVN